MWATEKYFLSGDGLRKKIKVWDISGVESSGLKYTNSKLCLRNYIKGYNIGNSLGVFCFEAITLSASKYEY